MKQDYPILEYDSVRRAVIEPSEQIKNIGAPEHCVICFFKEVTEGVAKKKKARKLKTVRWEGSSHTLYGMEEKGRPVAFIHSGVGAPQAAGFLEEIIAMGCRKFIACGGAGVLDREIAVGHPVVPTSAVRDEGTSYHYLPPSREVEPSPEAVKAIEKTMKNNDIEYVSGKTWTTDAPYRETSKKVKLRWSEGCITVEMEAAAFFAVAKFRKVLFGQILYGGDDVSGEKWDTRGWHERASAREKLFRLAVEACLRL